MITMEQIPGVLGNTAYDRSHRKIGKVGHVYLDTQTGKPEWLTVRTNLIGTNESFVPLGEAEVRGQEITVPFEKDKVEGAPSVEVEASGYLPEEQEIRLYDYYGLAFPGPAPQAPPTAPSDNAMTRSEERMRVGTERRETGRARLRKYVVTEDQQQTVPVRHDEVHVEREPITEQNRGRAMAGPAFSEKDYEVVLEEERPVVSTEEVPVERVRLAKDTVSGQETVSGRVRKERIEAEGVPENRR